MYATFLFVPETRPSDPAFWAVFELRPSGPPLATQRRVISVVGEQNGKDCDHADRANGGLLADGKRCSQRRRRGVPGSVIVRSVSLCRVVVPAQLRTPHSRWRGFPGRLSLLRSLSPGRSSGTVVDPIAHPDTKRNPDTRLCQRELRLGRCHRRSATDTLPNHADLCSGADPSPSPDADHLPVR